MPYQASYFRPSMFRQCRHRYKLHYVDDLAEVYRKPRPYLTMGEHVHGLPTTRDMRHTGLTAAEQVPRSFFAEVAARSVQPGLGGV